jgi:hypothetical protein
MATVTWTPEEGGLSQLVNLLVESQVRRHRAARRRSSLPS